MACTSEISIGYQIGTKPVVTIPTFVVTSAGTMNGKDYYLWNDPWSLEPMILFWNNILNYWVITLQSNTSDPLAYLDLPKTDCPGLNGENNWQITESGASFEFNTFGTIVVPPPDPQCVNWETPASLPSPWNAYTLGLIDFALYNTLYVGQAVTTFTAAFPYPAGVGYYTIGAIIYFSGSTIYHEPGPGRVFIGVVLVDANGEILVPGNNNGYICFAPAPENPLTPAEECFNILVWNKQCEFAQCVLKYLNKLQFGINSCKDLESLKNKRRALLILNCYDTRDIANNTTDYNFLTYTQIKKLLK